MAKRARKLGHRQLECLKGMVEYTRDGTWSDAPGGWNWTTTGATLTIMRSLEAHGYVEVVPRDSHYKLFRITPVGRMMITMAARPRTSPPTHALERKGYVTLCGKDGTRVKHWASDPDKVSCRDCRQQIDKGTTIFTP